MNQKKKQSIVAVVATVLTLTCVISPCASVYATETDKIITQQNETPKIKLAQENTVVLINEATFPDEGFRNYVKKEFNKSEGAEITDEIAKVTDIDVSGDLAITDLTGIEHFTALKLLDCVNTGIEKLDVSKNPKLTILYCYKNENLKELTVKGATALTELYCYSTKITSLDVSKNPKLTFLDCYKNENLKELTVKGATALTELYCYGTGIEELDVSKNKNLFIFVCNSTKITSLDVSNNKNLHALHYSDTGITSLDVSNNEELRVLNCSETGITSLDVSNNKYLTYLYCNNTGIQDLDVSSNPDLIKLDCFDTGITSLDVSNNKDLEWLNCSNTPLAYLNLGTSNKLVDLWIDDLQPVDIELTKDTFNVKDIFPDITIGNITVISGANYDKATGVMSNYTLGKNITYKYDCGKANNNPITIEVSLLPMGKSTISITDNLNKTYDGTAVSPEVKKEGSSSAVSYKWERKKNANDWEDIASAPKDVGTYRVTATLPSDEAYNGATSKPVEFTISQATNDWTNTLSIKDWTYNETANNPTATAKFGTVEYLYSGSKNGKYADVVPANAGIWYVKAVVEGTDNYEGLESEPFKFEIKKAKAPAISLPANLSGVYDTKLSAIALLDGWSWVNGEETLTASNTGYKAILAVDDSNYDYTGTEGYDSTNHYVERTLTVTVSEAKNTWTQEPVIADWTYGETASVPMADAKYGDVTFSYSNSENGTFTSDKPTKAGTWYVKAVVAGTENYTGMETILDFTIAPKSIDNNSSIIISDINNDKDLDNLVIKDGDKELGKGTDYDVDKKQNDNEVIVTITFKGNYTGTITKTYTVNVDKPKDSVSVSTGDTTHTGLLATMSLLSAGCIAFLTGKKRRKEF